MQEGVIPEIFMRMKMVFWPNNLAASQLPYKIEY